MHESITPPHGTTWSATIQTPDPPGLAWQAAPAPAWATSCAQAGERGAGQRQTPEEAPVLVHTPAGGRYPQDGERIGPLWEALWGLMVPGEWYHASEFHGLAKRHRVSRDTIDNLMGQARRHRVVESRRQGKRMMNRRPTGEA